MRRIRFLILNLLRKRFIFKLAETKNLMLATCFMHNKSKRSDMEKWIDSLLQANFCSLSLKKIYFIICFACSVRCTVMFRWHKRYKFSSCSLKTSLTLKKVSIPHSVELQSSQEQIFLRGDVYWNLGGLLWASCFVTGGGAVRISSVGLDAARLCCVSDRP